MPTPYTIAAQYELERPSDVSGRKFEEMCLIIYSHQYSDGMFYSRGHLQHGVDLKMREHRDGSTREVLVQCKNTKTLAAADLKKDMTAALKRWGPTEQTQHDLLYVVSTTVEQPDTDEFEAEFLKIRDQIIAAPLRGKVTLLVHGWADLTRLVRATEALTDYFLAPLVDHGAPESVDLERIGACLGECLESGRIEEARQYWDQAEREHPGAKLPAMFTDNLIELFLRAGDFAALDRYLHRLLPSRRYRAGYWVAYLRAKRFTTKVTRPMTFNELMKSRPVPPFDLGATIRQQKASLLAAQGVLDETLTLAGWMIAYGEHAVARAGLLRALSLIRQHWKRETGLDLPERGDSVTIYEGRLVPIAQSPWPNYVAPVRTTAGERTAVVFVQAYEYLRMLFETRFGHESLIGAEASVQGWMDFIKEDHRALSVGEYFAFLHVPGFEKEEEARFHEAGLIGFYTEAMRMQFGWRQTDVMYVHDTSPPYSVVCTSRLLLADCEFECFDKRRHEAWLIAPTMAIERVLATLRLLDILDEETRRLSGRTEGNEYSKRADKVRALLRACSLEHRRDGSRDVLVRPVYESAQVIEAESALDVVRPHTPAGAFPSRDGWANVDRPNAELEAVIAMSNAGIAPMIGSCSEVAHAQASGALRVQHPWQVFPHIPSTAYMGRQW